MAVVLKRAAAGLLFGAGALLVPQSLGAEDMAAYASLNAGLVAEHIIPRYRELADATVALDQAAETFCSDPQSPRLAALQQEFRKSIDSWMRVQHIRFGPVEFLLRYDRFVFWPDKRNTVGRHMNTLLAAGDHSALDPDTFAKGSVAVQGFSAVERLLFGESATARLTGQNEAGTFACDLVTAITGNLARMARGTLTGWLEGENAYRQVIGSASEGNAFYRDAKEASLDFFKALNSGLTLMVDLKLAQPLGSAVSKAKPRRAENWRSGRSLENLAANLVSLEDLYAGDGGFSTLLLTGPGNRGLDREMRDGFQAARAALEGITVPLPEAVGDPAERMKVERLQQELQALRDLTSGRLATALDIQPGFNAFDGD